MRFRIGINLGDVIEKADGTVYGDGVNVAARLQALAEPGSIIISGTAYDEISDRVDVSFVYVGEKTVKNINRPVRAYRLSGEDEAAIGPVQVAALFRRNRITLSAAIALLVTVFLGMFLSSHSPWPRSDPVATVEADNLGLSDDTESTADDRILAMPAGPSIAVLPFDNLSDDPDQEYFGEALAENIITSLSRFTDLFVIARNSTFQYKNKPIDIRKVGDELGARYVLEGSIQKFETRIRITAQLIDAKTGNHVWAESYDRDLTVENILDLQDEIRDHIVAEIAGGYGVIAESVIKATKERRPQNLQAYICVLRAKDYYRVFSEEEHLKVRNCLETVMTPDSDYAVGWAWLGLIVLDEWRFNFNRRQDVEQPLDRAFEYARRAVALDPRSQDAQHALFKIHFFRKELDLFKIHVEKALLLNPNNVFTLLDAGFFLGFSGRWDKGVAIIRKAMDLNPN